VTDDADKPVDPARRLIPQAHGGALLPPFGREGRNPARYGTSLRAVRKECRALLASEAVKNFERLLLLCQSDDARVSVVAIQECNNRLFGRIGDQGVSGEDDGKLSVTHLTDAERGELAAAVKTVRRLTGLARLRAEGAIIEAEETA
jgi:hypothetical protein